MVGGISRTVERDGWRFDIGGHRFFTKVPEVEALWHEILPDEDFLLRPRMSRIYYNGKFFDYPLRAMNALARPRPRRGGPLRAARTSGRGSGRRRTRPTSRAGRRPASAGGSTASSSRPTPRRCGACRPSEIPADWAAQRIKNLSLGKAIVERAPAQAEPEGHHLAHRGVPVPEVRARDDVGGLPGQGGRAPGPRCGCRHAGRADRARRRPAPRRSTVDGADGADTAAVPPQVISSMPLGALVQAMDPPPPDEVLAAADGLPLPRLPDRRPRRARARTPSPTTGSTSTRPT